MLCSVSVSFGSNCQIPVTSFGVVTRGDLCCNIYSHYRYLGIVAKPGDDTLGVPVSRILSSWLHGRLASPCQLSVKPLKEDFLEKVLPDRKQSIRKIPSTHKEYRAISRPTQHQSSDVRETLQALKGTKILGRIPDPHGSSEKCKQLPHPERKKISHRAGSTGGQIASLNWLFFLSPLLLLLPCLPTGMTKMNGRRVIPTPIVMNATSFPSVTHNRLGFI
ncbi:hypothetical protein AVEN_22255-1 [Araneus ventricosus]|uniref:Uncharacterized protein n=1 Tax=Araneus ventricosus TaxID=182803 RepID=A0A4Y2U0W4_ARAVE|nr:hypothetical protein AVEN_22255-1 [Araneus ventricosus]